MVHGSWSIVHGSWSSITDHCLPFTVHCLPFTVYRSQKLLIPFIIDAKTNKVSNQENSTVSSLNNKDAVISFKYLAKSLPFPMDSNARVWQNPQKQYEALKVIPFVKEFDEEMLTVKGLDASKSYSLKIVGNTISNFMGGQFNDGINLALSGNTPQYQQAKQIMELQLKRKDLEDKLRSFVWVNYDFLLPKGLFMQDTPAVMDTVLAGVKTNPFMGGKKDAYLETHDKAKRDAIQKQMDDMADEMYKLAQPLEHMILIEPVK